MSDTFIGICKFCNEEKDLIDGMCEWCYEEIIQGSEPLDKEQTQ